MVFDWGFGTLVTNSLWKNNVPRHALTHCRMLSEEARQNPTNTTRPPALRGCNPHQQMDGFDDPCRLAKPWQPASSTFLCFFPPLLFTAEVGRSWTALITRHSPGIGSNEGCHFYPGGPGIAKELASLSQSAFTSGAGSMVGHWFQQW